MTLSFQPVPEQPEDETPVKPAGWQFNRLLREAAGLSGAALDQPMGGLLDAPPTPEPLRFLVYAGVEYPEDRGFGVMDPTGRPTIKFARIVTGAAALEPTINAAYAAVGRLCVVVIVPLNDPMELAQFVNPVWSLIGKIRLDPVPAPS